MQTLRRHLIIFLVCFVPRALYLTLVEVSPYTSFYWPLSGELLHRGTLSYGSTPTTFCEPFYPFFLALARRLTFDHLKLSVLLQIMAASLGANFFYKLSLSLSKSRGVAALAVLQYAFYPYFIRQSAAIIEVPLLTTLLILSAYTYCRASRPKDFALCGLAFGFTLLMRSTVLPVFLLALGAQAFKKQFKNALILAIAAFVPVLPVLVRNYGVDHSLLPTRSGINLLCGNCRYTGKLLPAYNLDGLYPYLSDLLEKEKPARIEWNEKQVDDFYLRKAWEYIREHPAETLKQKLKNIFYFFHPRLIPFYPETPTLRAGSWEEGKFEMEPLHSRGIAGEWAHTVSYSFILVTAWLGFFLRRRCLREDFILWAIVLGFILIYCILYFPATRYRAPMDFVFMFYSAVWLYPWFQAAGRKTKIIFARTA